MFAKFWFETVNIHQSLANIIYPQVTFTTVKIAYNLWQRQDNTPLKVTKNWKVTFLNGPLTGVEGDLSETE